MMLCSASTLHLAVDTKVPVSGRTVLPGPGGQATTVQSSQRPRFKATPGSDETLIDASAGAPMADPVIGNGALNPLHNYRDYSSNDCYYSCWTSNSTSYYSET
eukprot:5743182-Prymnesium_polylepis.1